MTVVHNRPIRALRAAITRAQKREDERLDKQARGFRFLRWRSRYKSAERQQRIQEVIHETASLGLVSNQRDKKFNGLEKRSRTKMAVALTPTQIKEANRSRLSKIVARKTIVDTALTKKAAVDAVHGKRKRGPMGGR